jgi:leucyl aminopeptidase (aminopeptidase T)
MRASFRDLRDREVALRRRLAGAEVAELAGPGGTDLRLGVAGREWFSDVVVRPGSYGNLPPGELWVAPVVARVKGRLVCDLLFHDTGRVPSPVTLELVRGRVVSVSSEDRGIVEQLEALLSVDEEAAMVGELGVGINAAARATGNMLEDAKRAGSVRLALGNNEDIPGGRNRSATHIDMLIKAPTLKVRRKSGRSRTIVDAGELVE